MRDIDLCCGARKRNAAFIAAGGAIAMSLGLVLLVAILLIVSYRETVDPDSRRAIGSLYSASLVVFGSWSLLTFVLLGGIRIENKRALLIWIFYSCILPVLFILDLAYLLATGRAGGGEIVYLVVFGVCLAVLAFIGWAIYRYYLEVVRRDKNPEERENELTFSAPYSVNPPPSGAPNSGYAASDSDAEQWKGRSGGRQSRFDATYGGDSKGSRSGSRDNSAEREGGTTYYRYQYSAEKYRERHQSGSQGSLSGSRQGINRMPTGGTDSTV